MPVRGWAQSATMEPIGSELVTALAIGSTVLPVEWVGMFDDEGGTLFINDEFITYSSVDEVAETITLDAPIEAAAGEGDGVHLVVGGQVATELVLHVSVGEGDPIEVVIPFEQRDLWPEGDFDEPVPVVLSDDYEQILDAPFRTSVRESLTDDIIELNDGLQDAYDAANDAAAAALDAALNATTALTAANGKNKVTVSLNEPGSAANAVGDIWFRKESATQTIIGQWEGLGGTDWLPKKLNDQVIANLDAGKLVAGSAFINGLWVKTNFTLGDAITDGVIQSYDFSNQPVGVFLNKYGIVAKGGSITGATIMGGVVKTGNSAARVQMLNAANPLEAGNVWGLIEFYNNLGWNPGRIWASEAGSEGTLRISSPHNGASTEHSRAAAITLISQADGSRRMNLYAGQMEFTANRYNYASANGTPIDFRLFNSGAALTIMDNNGDGAGFGSFRFAILGGTNLSHRLSTFNQNGSRHQMELLGASFAFNMNSGSTFMSMVGSDNNSLIPQLRGGSGFMALSFVDDVIRVSTWNSTALQKIAASEFSTTSDRRDKTNEVKVTGALKALRAMPVYDYDTPHGAPTLKSEARKALRLGDKRMGQVRTRARGMMAQDIAKVIPHAVNVDDVEPENPMTVNLYALLTTVAAAVQELDAKVDERLSA